MNIINGIIGIILFSSFIVIFYSQLKKIEMKICAVRNGTLQDKKFSKLIEKVQMSSEIKYTLYLPMGYGLLFSVVFIVILYPIDILLGVKDISVHQFSYLFLWMFITISVCQAIIARKVWTLCHQE